MDGIAGKKELKLIIPTNKDYNANHTSLTSIRREPNLKLQFRPATPVRVDGRSFLTARPSTPCDLKKVKSNPLPGSAIFSEEQNQQQEAEEVNKVRTLKKTMSLDINQNYANAGSAVNIKSKSCIRRERNAKLLQRQNTPVCCDMTDEGFFGGRFLPLENGTTPASPLTRNFVKTASPLSRKTSHPLSPLVRQSAITTETGTAKPVPSIQLSSDSGIEDLPVYDEDVEDQWVRNDSEQKLKRSLTINIPREYQSVDNIDEFDLLKRERSKSCYIRREPNLMVVYRLQTPKATEFPVNFEQKAKEEQNVSTAKEHSPHSPLRNKTNKSLMIDIPTLYEEKNSKGIVRREKNLKIFHRQDTPLSLYGNEGSFHFHPEGAI